MAQHSTERIQPESVVTAAANAQKTAPDITSYYMRWHDSGRSESANVEHLLAMITPWSKTPHPE